MLRILESLNNYIVYFLFALILLIIGCEKSKYMAPVVYKGHDSIDKIITSKTKTIIVKEGYTLFSISRKEGVSVRSIIEANNLKPPFCSII